MFANIGNMLSEKFSVVWSFVRKQRNVLLTTLCAALFVVVMGYAFKLVVDLRADVLDYEGKIAILSSRMEQWELAAKENTVLIAANNRLLDENKTLDAANGELERLNGELLKKYNGLSELN